MLYKFLVESYRNKKNRPLSFFVNYLGLTLGFAAVMVMYIFIMQQVRHDSDVFSSSMERVYRIEMGDPDMGSISPSGLQPFVADMAEVESATRVLTYINVVSTEGLAVDKKLKLKAIFADSTLLEVFPFKLSVGSLTTALGAPENVIISRAAAVKLFDSEDVVGRVIKLNNSIPVTITAVIKDVPNNSSFAPDIVATNAMLCKIWDMNPKNLTNWGHWNSETYIKIRGNVNVAAFGPKLSAAVTNQISKMWNSEYTSKITIRSFDDCYFNADGGYSHSKSVDPQSLYIMAIIAALILVIAIINYVNIYTARSTEVIRAMGIKAIMGAKRMQLISFVIFDSIVLALLSAVSAFIIAAPLEPLYPSILGEALNFSLSWDMIVILFVGIPVVCGVLSGVFPAISLTRLRPLDAMANRSSGGRQMAVVRNCLIVFQFTITIALIASTIFINKQMSYINDLELGYDRENIVVVDGSNFMGPKFETFRNKLLSNADISNISLMKNSPIMIDEFMTMSWGETEQEQYTVNVQWADENFLSLIDVDLVDGDSLNNANIHAETPMYMINEAFAEKIRAQNPSVQFPFKQFIGVFKDYQNANLSALVTPMAYGSIWSWRNTTPYGNAYIKISGKNLESTLKYIESTFAEMFPEQLYEWSFLDEQFNDMYKGSKIFQARLFTFSMLAIFIGCLGLFALVSYSVERRRKEIAIRKVYGSTVGQILTMLSISFLRWLIISFVIATPVVYLTMIQWVTEFAYRTELSWWIFGIAAVSTLIIALFTVLGQSYHAATQNPAKFVKAE